MTKSLEDKIRERAYALWEQDGRIHGKADEHWLKASLEVIGALAGGEIAQSASVEASPPMHEETQTTVDAAGVVTPKTRRIATKKATVPENPAVAKTSTKAKPSAAPRKRTKPTV